MLIADGRTGAGSPSSAGRALGELRAWLTQVPGDERSDHFGTSAFTDEVAKPDPKDLGDGYGNAEAMPVFLIVGHRSHGMAWLAALSTFGWPWLLAWLATWR